QRHALLVQVHEAEEDRVHARLLAEPIACRLARRRLDLDDLGAQPRQRLRAARPRLVKRKIEHPQALERRPPHRPPLRSVSRAATQGCGPHGAAVSSLTSWDATSARNFTAKPSMKSLLPNTDAQCARRSSSLSNFHRWTSWLIVPVSA